MTNINEEAAKKLIKKIEDDIGDHGEELLGKDTCRQLEKSLREMFAREGLEFKTSHIKAFYEGVTMASGSGGKQELIMPLITFLRVLLRKGEKEVSKAADAAVERLLGESDEGPKQ